MRLDKKKLLVLIFVFAFSIRIISAYISPIKWWDETIYADLGWNLKSNPFDYSFKYFGDANADWPKSGFRAPLLPYIITMVYTITESNFFVELLMPLIGAFGVVLLFLLMDKMFDERTALWAALFLAVLPLHVYHSGKILTDVLATTLLTIAFLCFWLGFHKGRFKFKVLSGIFTALTILARYTLIWLPFVFLIYLTIKNKGFRYLKDKGFILCLLVFFLTLAPWFWYSYNTYGTPLGSLIHAQKADAQLEGVWWGPEAWYFYFQYFPLMFGFVLFPFLFGIIFAIKNLKNYSYLLILFWFFTALIVSMVMEHKEDRFLMPITPALCAIAATVIKKVNVHPNIFVLVIVLLTLTITIKSFVETVQTSYTEQNLCFLEAVKALGRTENNSLIFSDSSPIVYYYARRETSFIPQSYAGLIEIAKNQNRTSYFLWSVYDAGVRFEELENSSIFYKCPENGEFAVVYKINI